MDASDYPEDIPVTWEEQVQKAVDCYNAGATVLHIHVRDPKTGHISKNFQEYSDQIGRLTASRTEDGIANRWFDLVRARAGRCCREMAVKVADVITEASQQSGK